MLGRANAPAGCLLGNRLIGVACRRTIAPDVTAHAIQETDADVLDAPVQAPPSLSAVQLRRPSSAVFDIPIDLAHPTELLRTISGWAAEARTRRVMYVNAHVVNQSRITPGLGAALRRADLVYCDGYGVRLAARVLNTPVPHRMTGADWIWSLAALCELYGQPIYLLGSEPPVAQEAAARLRRSYPGLSVAGAHHGFFDLGSPHNERVIEDINAHTPRIVLVGMGTPKQELWVDRYAERLERAVVCGQLARCSTTYPAGCRAPPDGWPTTDSNGSFDSRSSRSGCGGDTCPATPCSCRGCSPRHGARTES